MRLTCEGYVAILDATIDKMLANRHAGMESGEDQMSADYVMVGGFLGRGKDDGPAAAGGALFRRRAVASA